MKQILMALVLFMSASLPSAFAQETGALCDGPVVQAYVGPMMSSVAIKETAKGLILTGRLNEGWLDAKVEDSTDGVRFNGWIGSQPLSLKVTTLSAAESRISGYLGSGDVVSVRVKVKKSDEVRVSGSGRHGPVSLTLFRGESGGIHGYMGRESVNLNANEASSGEASDFSMSGQIGNNSGIAEIEASACANSLVWSPAVSTSELMSLIVLLSR